jgi:hypothetical protein
MTTVNLKEDNDEQRNEEKSDPSIPIRKGMGMTSSARRFRKQNHALRRSLPRMSVSDTIPTSF